MFSSSAGSLGLLERARSLRFAQTGYKGAFEDMVEEAIGSMKEEGNRDMNFQNFIGVKAPEFTVKYALAFDTKASPPSRINCCVVVRGDD